MGIPFLLVGFIFWYYSRAILDLIAVWFNFMWFITNFFSIPLLIGTLFSPWKRMTDDEKPKSVEAFMEAFVMNVTSRIFGACIRIVIVAVGLIALVIGVLILGALLAVWFFLPFILIFGIVYGVTLLVP